MMDELRVSGSDAREDVDESTRLLCIGAHLDRVFADAAIQEFLTQPRRALPPSLGVDARSVLAECLAARNRRLIRDAALSGLMFLFVFYNQFFFVVWLMVAVGWRQVGPSRRRLDRAIRSVAGVRAAIFAIIGVVLVVVVLLGLLAGTVLALISRFLRPQGAFGSQAGSVGETSTLGVVLLTAFVWPGILGLAMFAVLWFDRRVVWSAITGRLRHKRPGSAVQARSDILGLSSASTGASIYACNLDKIEAPHVNCVVYRGDWPFVGSGVPFQPWSIALALESTRPRSSAGVLDPVAAEYIGAQASAAQPELSIIGLHDAVARELRKLVGDSSLSPSRRLSGLRTEGMVYIPARALAHERGRPELREVFGSGCPRPNPQISGALLRQIAQSPQEWMRYYANYVVESWDREVTVSVLVHYGLDDRHLYVECTPCVLRPVTPRYRNADGLSDRTSAPAVLDALGSWAVLPLTVISRFLHTVSPITDVYKGSEDVERFGAAMSLRELAASRTFADYVQESDVNRYAQVLQTRIIRAIGGYLESCGLSTVDFMRQTDAAIKNFVVSGGIHNSNIGGGGNVVVNQAGNGSAVPG
jgi:hypothetical protein